MDAIIPIEIGMPPLRIEIPVEANTEALAKDLDMTDELVVAAAVCMASYQQGTTNLYNTQVRQHTFQVKNLVLRKVFENTANPAAGKFQSKYERPYTIVREGLAESYTLDKLDEMPVPKMRNVMHLKRYYE